MTALKWLPFLQCPISDAGDFGHFSHSLICYHHNSAASFSTPVIHLVFFYSEYTDTFCTNVNVVVVCIGSDRQCCVQWWTAVSTTWQNWLSDWFPRRHIPQCSVAAVVSHSVPHVFSASVHWTSVKCLCMSMHVLQCRTCDMSLCCCVVMYVTSDLVLCDDLHSVTLHMFSLHVRYHSTTTTILWPFFLDHSGEPVLE